MSTGYLDQIFNKTYNLNALISFLNLWSFNFVGDVTPDSKGEVVEEFSKAECADSTT